MEYMRPMHAFFRMDFRTWRAFAVKPNTVTFRRASGNFSANLTVFLIAAMLGITLSGSSRRENFRQYFDFTSSGSLGSAATKGMTQLRASAPSGSAWTCNIVRPVRSKHCNACGVCVGKFDHHCEFSLRHQRSWSSTAQPAINIALKTELLFAGVWTNNCVGYRNM